MRIVKLAAYVTCLSLVACKPEGSDDAADEAEASSGASESESSSSTSSTDSNSTDATSTDSSSTDSSSTDSTSTDSSSSSTDSTSTDSSSSSTDSSSTDSSSTDSGSSSTTLGETTSDTGFESCEMIEMLYQELVESPLNFACNADADCHVVDGHCWMGLGGCWYVVNQNLQQTDLETLANGFSGLGCFGPICLCIEAPAAVGCVNGTCMPLP